MHEPDIEATARRDVPGLRVRRPARLDRDLGDVKLDVHGAAERLPRIRQGPQLQDDVGLRTHLRPTRPARNPVPDLETMASNRAMRWVGNVARMHPGRLPQQVLYGWPWMPHPRLRGGQTKHQGHRINRILRNRAANADPKIRHRFYKNGTDISKITSDTDPVNWHVVAQDRTTWTSTMLTGVPTNPTVTRT